MGSLKRKIINGFLRVFRITSILKNQEEIIKLQRENLYGLKFNNSIQDSNWLRYKSFSPGYWAVDYSFLYVLFKILNYVHPSEIIEFGLGQSSKMIHQYASYFKINAVTIEHDKNWVKFFSKDKQGEYDVNIQLLDLEMIDYKGFETRTYAGINEFCLNKTYDLIVVDGPRGSAHYSRPQLLNLVNANLKKTFCIIIDDTERTGEQETLNEVYSYLNDHHIDYCCKTYSSIKSFTVVCSKDLHFLTTL